ncbi:MAG: GrrA/OscA1 family cyclophane-containing rSAM-modified RiPP [Xenococcaceae cyanobacterium MO_167.B52]|nr:GrrA/OscA1 family cyclophane-containing rSAM-modified RiPP [Xenococcaceae cyanobacterium MO_167.B52]
MKSTKITWISFIVTLASLNFPVKTQAHQTETVPTETPQILESRLSRIATTLKARENQIPESSTLKKTIEIAGWGKGGRGGFLNNRGGGGFLNNRGWRDGGGFLNRR